MMAYLSREVRAGQENRGQEGQEGQGREGKTAASYLVYPPPLGRAPQHLTFAEPQPGGDPAGGIPRGLIGMRSRGRPTGPGPKTACLLAKEMNQPVPHSTSTARPPTALPAHLSTCAPLGG